MEAVLFICAVLGVAAAVYVRSREKATLNRIDEMLDEAIAAFQKRLDSLFADQALDIETDIKVMNTMLAREGLTGEKDFDVQQQKGQTT